ncbi:MAG: cupin domain-containing protein [Candidatus Woesearchaeota archaeon]|nr:cupin domain-containing protein [Candidatus Woesearchaeota archaeon]
MRADSLAKQKWKNRFTYVKTIPFDETALRSKGARFQIVKFLPQTAIEPHYHKNVTEIFYIRSGNGILRINNKEFRCKPDDFFLCEPGDMHEFLNDTDQEFIILIFKTNESAEDIFFQAKPSCNPLSFEQASFFRKNSRKPS